MKRNSLTSINYGGYFSNIKTNRNHNEPVHNFTIYYLFSVCTWRMRFKIGIEDLVRFDDTNRKNKHSNNFMNKADLIEDFSWMQERDRERVQIENIFDVSSFFQNWSMCAVPLKPNAEKSMLSTQWICSVVKMVVSFRSDEGAKTTKEKNSSKRSANVHLC